MSDYFSEQNPEIYEPLKMYSEVYRELHDKNATQLFDELTAQSGVNIEANRETIKKLNIASSNRDDIRRRIRKAKGLVALFVFLCILGVFLTIFSLMYLIHNQEVSWHLALAILGVGLIPLSIVIMKKQSKIGKELEIEEKEASSVVSKLTTEAWKQLIPLNKLLSIKIPQELFKKTVPIINLDPMFDIKRFDYLVSRFGLIDAPDPQRSTLFVQSGEIVGNPFYIANDLVHTMGTKNYTGTKLITWTTTSVVKGQRVTHHHSQTLSATITKPFPMYKEKAYLLYANDAAPDLMFARRDSDAENLSQAQIDRLVNKQIKKIQKKSEKSTMKGGTFTVSGNSEFEVLFGATNRNNEVQYRLLFTPLAQKQLLDLMKEKSIGFGDDFDFIKNKKLNYIYPAQLNSFQLQIKEGFFNGHDYDKMRRYFISYNNKYFRHLYFAIAPILAIPLYQQQKPREYIYKDYYSSYLSFYEHEAVANRLNSSEFVHPLSKTRNILKTSTVKTGDDYDIIKVEAKGYRTEPRRDYVSKLGGDGRMHSIAIDWEEYLPVSKVSTVAVALEKDEETDKSYADQIRKSIEGFSKGDIDKEKLFKVASFIVYKMNS